MEAIQSAELPRNTPANRMIQLTRWNDYHDDPPVGGLRWMVFNAAQTGFDKVIKRRGKRIYIDEQAFFAWIEAQS